MAIVSFDYDSTLSEAVVEEFAKQLVDEGHEVWIVTRRFDSVEKYTEEFMNSYLIPKERLAIEHNSLFVTADRIGIPRDRIVFTNMLYKFGYFKDNPNFSWHLDDDLEEVGMMAEHCKVIPIRWINEPYWREICLSLIE